MWWKLNFTIRLCDLVTGDFVSEESSMYFTLPLFKYVILGRLLAVVNEN